MISTDHSMKKDASLLKTGVFTVLALIAFAANSVLCRLALDGNTIDAASFTVMRLASGIVMLMLILTFMPKRPHISSHADKATRGSWISAWMLFLYAITFSFAYVSLDTATGALVLFGAVQITMIFAHVMAGNRLHIFEWSGLLLAFTGFVCLMLPDVTTPSFSGFVLMTLAGIAWGIYTLRGKKTLFPLPDTAFNFLRTTPFVIALVLMALPSIQLSSEGIMLAIMSGALASGIGYTLWYIALGGLSATVAAVVQLLVPIIAAIGGIIFVFETITQRLILSGMMILGGVLIITLGQRYLLPAHTKVKP